MTILMMHGETDDPNAKPVGGANFFINGVPFRFTEEQAVALGLIEVKQLVLPDGLTMDAENAATRIIIDFEDSDETPAECAKRLQAIYNGPDELLADVAAMLSAWEDEPLSATGAAVTAFHIFRGEGPKEAVYRDKYPRPAPPLESK